MNEDNELLEQYAENGDEAAFSELVRRQVNLVHSAALRQVYGDAQLAKEVTQEVFLTLARKARALSRHSALSGWLYMTTRFAAAKALRSQKRWQNRTKEAKAMHETQQDDNQDQAWDQLRYVLDEAMEKLGHSDREVLLLRYFEDRPLAEVGAKIGLSENTARMRVDRALDKLRAVLGRRGITSTGAALAFLLSRNAVAAAPAGVAAAATDAALAGAAAVAGAWAVSKTVLLAVALTATAALVTIIYQYRLTQPLQPQNAGPVPAGAVATGRGLPGARGGARGTAGGGPVPGGRRGGAAPAPGGLPPFPLPAKADSGATAASP